MRNKKKFSISVPSDVLESMRNSAAREDMSVNKYINKTLESFAAWGSQNSEFIPIRRALLEKFLDKFTHEEIDILAEHMARARNKDTVMWATSQFNAENMIRTFEAWLRMTGFPYSHDTKGSVHRFLVLHGLGDKWSQYLAKLMAITLNQIDIIPKLEYTGKIFSITIDIRQIEDARKRTEKQIEILDAEIKKIKAK